MELVRNFTKLSKDNADIAGGKGASLGEMTQAGIPVPPGFVVLSSSFERFLKETNLVEEIDAILDAVSHKEIHTVESASEKIKALILSRDMPTDIESEIEKDFKELDAKFVAVRSSATAEDGKDHAWAGQLDSFLNTTHVDLLDKVKHCWASLFTPRAIFYRFEKGLHTTKISVAVVVQKMVESEVSGIAFSVHPVTEDRNQLIIEAGFGLGEAIVSGQITPDSYVVEKNPRRIIDVNISEQVKGLYKKEGGGNEWRDLGEKGKEQVLNEKQILELSEIILGIENHYGFPCDIEWAFEKGKFYIVQSRPITTLSVKKEVSSPTSVDGQEWFLTVTRNMSFWHQCLCNEGTYHSTPDFGVEANLNIMSLTIDSTRTSIFVYKENFSKFSDAIIKATASLERFSKLKGKYEHFAKNLVDALEKATADLNTKTFKEFIDAYRIFTAGLMITTTLGRVQHEVLNARLKEIGYKDEEIPSIIATVTYPEEKTPFFNSQIDLLKIGVEVQEHKISKELLEEMLDAWISKHSHVPVNFCEEPYSRDDLQSQLKEVLKYDCREKMVFLKKQHDESIENADSLLNKIDDSEVTRLGKTLAGITSLNEFRKGIFCKVSLRYRPLFANIVGKLGSKKWRDAFYLKSEEMFDILDGKVFDLETIINVRAKVAMYIDSKGQLTFLDTSKTDGLYDLVYSEKPPVEGSEIIKGFSANKGKITAVAKVILSSKDFAKLLPGEILITTMTSVDFVPIMERAGAFVTNEGGITSHASIVAREMNKPCIIGTKNGTQVIKDGDMVEVDADKGVVTILNSKKKDKKRLSETKEERIPTTNWIKYWEAPLKPLYAFTSLQLGEISTYLGPEISLHKIFVMYEKGVMSAYYYFPDVELFQKGSVAYLEKKDGPSDLKKRVEVLLSKIQELGRNTDYNKDDLILLKTLFDETHVYVGVIKTAGDASIDQKTFNDLLDLRKRTENIFFDLNTILEKIANKSIGGGPSNLDEAMMLSYDELLCFLENKNLPPREEILERATCALYVTQEGFKELKKIEYQPILNEINLEIHDSTLKGQPAYKGIVRGKCVVIRDFSLNSDIPEGSILVTGMTDPRFVPIMKKAAAIITDAGGMLSHAAIVSRELKIPCIVGTRLATQVLKDGDMVEVDANNGAVNILSSTTPFDPSKIEWHKLMERKNLFFVGLAFTDVESKDFGKIMGFDLKHFLFKFENGNWSTYKSTEEFKKLYEHISGLIKSKDRRFIKFTNEGVKYNEEGGKYIKQHILKPTEPSLKNFDNEYDLYRNILLYGVTIPWDVIGAIETMDRKEQIKYADTLDAFEPLRAESLYPDFEKEVLQKYRKYLAEKYGIDLSLMNLLTPQELRKAIEGENIPDKDKLKKRYDYCVYWHDPENNQIKFIFDASIEKKIPVLQKIKIESENFVKGTIAYKGLVKGKVRIVYEPQDCRSFEEGEILVSPSTNPSLMVAIQRCVGIVTDEGGMTSHAAIIARELKKPAVIGTKYATQLFKDGDMVEVDANSGIVKILK